MKFCPECGAKVEWMKFCPECGHKLDNDVTDDLGDTAAKSDLYETGTVGSSTSSTQDVTVKKKRPAGCWIGLVIIIALLFGLVYAFTHLEDVENIEIKEATGINNEQAQDIADILTKCEVTDIQSVEHDKVLDDKKLKGYRIEFSLGEAQLYLKGANTNKVRFNTKYLYKKGKVVAKSSDYAVTNDEATKVQVDTQEAVKQCLKSPATADFPNITKWAIWKEDGKIYAQSFVDSQNSFGAEIRNEFQAVWKNRSLQSLIIDGTEYSNTSKTTKKESPAVKAKTTSSNRHNNSQGYYEPPSSEIIGMWEGDWMDGGRIEFDFLNNNDFYCSTYYGNDYNSTQGKYWLEGNQLKLDTGETYTIKSVGKGILKLKTYGGTYSLDRMSV